jgi:hypothetical protein
LLSGDDCGAKLPAPPDNAESTSVASTPLPAVVPGLASIPHELVAFRLGDPKGSSSEKLAMIRSLVPGVAFGLRNGSPVKDALARKKLYVMGGVESVGGQSEYSRANG